MWTPIARLKSTSYVDSSGETQYPVRLVVEGTPTYLESKSVTEARRSSLAPATAPTASAEGARFRCNT